MHCEDEIDNLITDIEDILNNIIVILYHNLNITFE